jgi:hypothetical protein
MYDEVDVDRTGLARACAGRPLAQYLLGGRRYLLRARHSGSAPGAQFEMVAQMWHRGGHLAERLLDEIFETDPGGARETFWRYLATDLLDDPERVAYAEIGLERVGMVRDLAIDRWHVGVVGLRAGAAIMPYADPAEAMRAWLKLVATLTPS